MMAILSNAPRISAAQNNYMLILLNILNYETCELTQKWHMTVVTIPTVIKRTVKTYPKKNLSMITNYSEMPSIHFPQTGLAL
jgi:hypothetical protein